MAEVSGETQYLGRFNGADQQVGAGLTYPHPLFPSGKALTTRRVKRLIIRASENNAGNITVSNKTSPSNNVISMVPGESRDWIMYNPGERWTLGNFYITAGGSDYAEVSYIL